MITATAQLMKPTRLIQAASCPGRAPRAMQASTCIAGTETACQTGAPTGVAETICNGVDDNCDGSTDEAYAADSSCFLPGACAAGNAASTCIAGTETACQTGAPTGVQKQL